MLAIKHVFTTLKTVITWGGIEATSQHVLNVQSMIMNNAVMPLPCGGTESARRLLLLVARRCGGTTAWAEI